MNLYKILSRVGIKTHQIGIKIFVLAESDNDVYEWLASEPYINDDDQLTNAWKDGENYGEEFEIYDNNNNVIGIENFKEMIMRENGQMNDDYYGPIDEHHGIILYGWELIKENVTINCDELIDLGVIIKI